MPLCLSWRNDNAIVLTSNCRSNVDAILEIGIIDDHALSVIRKSFQHLLEEIITTGGSSLSCDGTRDFFQPEIIIVVEYEVDLWLWPVDETGHRCGAQ